MTLITRLSRLVKADFHAVLDRIEEPEQLLKQAIRDMEAELVATERRMKVCGHDQQILGARKRELAGKLGEIDEELDLCFASGKDALAKSLVKKKLEAQRLLQRLNAKHTANESSLTEQRARLAENRTTLESLKQKAELFAETEATSEASGLDDIAWIAREAAVGEDEIEVAFLREKGLRSAP